jgi:hypothetical protein
MNKQIKLLGGCCHGKKMIVSDNNDIITVIHKNNKSCSEDWCACEMIPLDEMNESNHYISTKYRIGDCQVYIKEGTKPESYKLIQQLIHKRVADQMRNNISNDCYLNKGKLWSLI